MFYRNWIYVGRAERVARAGAWMRVEVADESILVVRGKDEQIRAFYNVCRHRGSRICDDEQGEVRTHLRCPYHAWGYALDGTLVTTPMIEKDEIDRPSTSLWPVHVEVWEGFVFVNLSREKPRPLVEHLADQQDEPLGWRGSDWPTCRSARSPSTRSRPTGRSSSRTTTSVCTARRSTPSWWRSFRRTRRAASSRDGRADGGVTLADGRTAVADDPRLRLPLLPGFKKDDDPESYYGALVYPTMFLDVDGSSCLATAVLPTGPQSCRLVTEYLFSPEALADPEFDPSPIVEFNERVTQQDNEACERVQRGVTSRAFDHGVFPAKDSWVYGFDQRYLRDVT